MGGFGKLLPEVAGVGGVDAVWSAEDAETGCSDGGSRPDIMEMSSRIRIWVSMIGWMPSEVAVSALATGRTVERAVGDWSRES